MRSSSQGDEVVLGIITELL